MDPTKERGEKEEPRLSDILAEIRAVRHELSLIMETEILDEYDDPEGLRHAYEESMRLHPPA
jgi:hypothetical protein